MVLGAAGHYRLPMQWGPGQRLESPRPRLTLPCQVLRLELRPRAAPRGVKAACQTSGAETPPRGHRFAAVNTQRGRQEQEAACEERVGHPGGRGVRGMRGPS